MSIVYRKGRKPRSEPRPSVTFSPTELDIISEALRIGSTELAYVAEAQERLWPSSPLVEKNRIFAEQMQDLRERIEA